MLFRSVIPWKGCSFRTASESGKPYTRATSDITLPAGYAWAAPTTSLGIGNGQSFPATYTDPSGNYAAATGTIAVNVSKATGTFVAIAARSATYSTTLKLSDITLPSGYAWNTPTTAITSIGNGQSFPATYTDPSGNYAAATGTIAVNVSKATGTFVALSARSATYSTTLKLSDISLPAGYVWNAPTTSLGIGNGQSFPATYTDPSGNYAAATGTITVNVSKAAGTFPALATLNTTYTTTLKLSDITLPAGYAWNAPATAVTSAGSGQSFLANYTAPGGNYTTASGNITVNVAKAAGSFVALAAYDLIYAASLTLANITLPAGYAWVAPTTSLSIGNGQSFAATYTNPSGNYNTATGNITVNVASQIGTFPALSARSAAYTTTLKLSDITLPAGYAWNDPATEITSAGDGQLFPATYTDPDGNSVPASGNIMVNVSKAAGTFSALSARSAIYSTTLKLSDITLPSGYAWAAPTTLLGIGNGQSFPAKYTDPSGNYNAASGSIMVNISKAAGAPVSGAPTINAATENSATIGAVTNIGGTGQSVEYAVSISNAGAPNGGWQSGLVFTGLTPNTTYYVYARTAANANYSAGQAQQSAGFQTSASVSTAKDIVGVVSPAGAVIDGAAIKGRAANTTSSLAIDIAVSQNAAWELFSDKACTSKLANKTMALAVGANTAYIKVTAQDGSAKVYTLTVTRAAAPQKLFGGEMVTLVRKQQNPVFSDAVKAYGGNGLTFKTSGKIRVDAAGKITYCFLGVGKAVITAYDAVTNEQVDSVEVNIKWPWHWMWIFLFFGWIYL